MPDVEQKPVARGNNDGGFDDFLTTLDDF